MLSVGNLVEEKNDLEVKVARLEIFTTSSQYKSLSYAEQHLLLRQKEAMQNYLNILRARVSLYQDFTSVPL